ncbi:hypothetical protein P8631_11465 (plasmid) [Guyparkeria sp. 1SP6A2]|nr:hypothetical protein [Guyparkeria sp. 1SP6A2]
MSEEVYDTEYALAYGYVGILRDASWPDGYGRVECDRTETGWRVRVVYEPDGINHQWSAVRGHFSRLGHACSAAERLHERILAEARAANLDPRLASRDLAAGQ